MAVHSLVQGAGRGLGLQFCRHILNSRPEAVILATCRNPDKATELSTLQQSFPNRLKVCKLDVTQEDDIKAASSFVKDTFGKLDLFVACAGMLHPSGRGETSLGAVSSQGLLETFSTNTVGPLLMAKHFAPMLTKGSGAFGTHQEKAKHTGILVNISAKVGSITDNSLGGWYSYRLSKAALNMATKNLSIELGRGRNKVICVALHPGTVDTDLSRPYHKNVPAGKLFTTEHSVSCMMKIVDNLTVADSGKYYNWDGSVLPF